MNINYYYDRNTLYRRWFTSWWKMIILYLIFFSHIACEYNSRIIGNESISIEDKVKKVIENKQKIITTIKELDENNLLSLFSHDWWIKLTLEDMEEIISSLYLVSDSTENWKQKIETPIEEHPFFHSLINDFCYFWANTLNFRNKNYYFLFDSLTISQTTKNTSINDYEIIDINFEDFKKDVYISYNRIDQYLKMFLEFFSWYTNYNIMERYVEFKSDILNIFWKDKIKELRELIENRPNYIENTSFNEKNKQNFLNLIEIIQDFVELVEKIKIPLNFEKDCHRNFYLQHIDKITKFLAINYVWFNHIKNIFKLDINQIFRKYIYTQVPPSLKKVILWIIDAKINILAFMQNITQILFNKNFFNPNFDWNLVLRKDQIDYIRKIVPKTIEDYRKFHNNITQNFSNNKDLAIELDTNIWYFMDILIWDKPESYIYASLTIEDDLKEIDKWYSENEIELFAPTFDLLKNLLKQIDEYWKDLDIKRKKAYDKEVKKALKHWKDLPWDFEEWKSKNYTDAKSNILKKLIRLHREENHPIVMINTAQNAYNQISLNWFKNTDSLHLLSVNYGWSLVWFFAKHTFERLAWKSILINLWNIVYSIYDLKNASEFLKIIDYPFVKYMEEYNSDEMKIFLRWTNHALIFDDNTCSWRTLNNLANLSKQSWYYWKIDIFACRVSQIIDWYDDSVSRNTVLELIKNASLESKKTRVWQVKRNYKELVWTIIWRNLYYSWYKWTTKK